MVIYVKVIEILFGLALFVNAMLFIPQAIKVFKTKNGKSISLITFTGFILIQFVSVLYGLVKHDWILIIGYLVSMGTCGLVVVCALLYRENN